MKPRDTKKTTKRRLARTGERGVVAILAALLVLGLIALILLAVQVGDIGMVRGLLQGSADEASLAGALQLDGTSDGLTNARSTAESMVAGGRNFPQAVNEGQDLNIGGTAFDTGVWDFANSDFTESNNPDQVNAVRVIGRKVNGQNNPVPMFLGGLLGSAGTVPVARSSIAAIGLASNLPCRFELPMAACEQKLKCGTVVTLIQQPNSGGVENSCFTGFDQGHSASVMKAMAKECSKIPAGIGQSDLIDLTNGQDTSVLQEIYDRWNALHCDTNPRPNVQLPDVENPSCKSDCGPRTTGAFIDINLDGVVDGKDCGLPASIPMISCPPSGCSAGLTPVTNFALIIITDVKKQGSPKYVKGLALCGIQFPGTQTDPGNCSGTGPAICSKIPILVNKDL